MTTDFTYVQVYTLRNGQTNKKLMDHPFLITNKILKTHLK